jgi:RimJ/RimL family protein N-acetyltransferase
MIGAISLHTQKAHNKAELGYWLGFEYWGRGYCTEATSALIRYGFTELGPHKITLRHFASNPASGRVMVKTGMIHEGALADEYCKDGIHHTSLVYGILNSEPPLSPR